MIFAINVEHNCKLFVIDLCSKQLFFSSLSCNSYLSVKRMYKNQLVSINVHASRHTRQITFMLCALF